MLLLSLLYLILSSIQYSEHTDNNISKLIDGVMKIKLSSYIKELINKELIIYLAFTLFNYILK